jgi:glycosyltransferase involved in cell wall biosynthesis
VITVHDLCFIEVPELYPLLQRLYYLSLLRRNLKHAELVVTVSETSKKTILKHFDLPPTKVLVIPNGLDSEFLEKSPTSLEISNLRESFGKCTFLILYSSGFENRKNLNRLVQALSILNNDGVDFKFLITGKVHTGWNQLLAEFPAIRDKTQFLGFLSNEDLKTAYSSVDVVVFPSLNEGFGRSCLESMSTGTPLACSNLPVFQEVAGDYAHYFSPKNPKEMSIKILEAINYGRKNPVQLVPIIESPGFMALREYLFGYSKAS